MAKGLARHGNGFRFVLVSFLALLTALTGSLVMPATPTRGVIFQVAVVDPTLKGFSNGDFDVADATFFPLQSGDGIPGNTGLIIDTFFAPVNTTVWFGVAAENGRGKVFLDSSNFYTSGPYGTFPKALCNDVSANGADFEDPADICAGMTGVGTARLEIADINNQIANLAPTTFPREGIAVPFRCPAQPGTARMVVGQGSFTITFFMVCHGPLSSLQLSATATTLEIIPQPGSVAHSLLKLQLFDQFGGIVAGRFVDWRVDRCAIEVDDVSTVEGALNVLSGTIPAHLTLAPDSNFQLDTGRNLVYDFDGDGKLEALALAVIHCEPPHAPSQSGGPLHVTATIMEPGGALFVASLTLTVIGPPAGISVIATPTSVPCGQKVAASAAVLDAAGQPVSDNTPVEFVANVGSTSSAVGFLAPVAPVSSSIAFTISGLATTYLLTSEVTTGTYEIVASAEGMPGLPPVTGSARISCFKQTPAVSAPTAQAASPAATAPRPIAPPNTGDAGIR